MKQLIFLFFLLLPLTFSPKVFAQAEPAEATAVKDDFQNAYFESLKQKAIENYDKAILEIEKCLKTQPENAVLHFEMGKNLLAQKKYDQAYTAFEKATQIDSKNRWYWVGMYDACYESKNYNKAIPIVEKLVEFKVDYKEDLVSLFMNTKQFDKAFELINELNDTFGKTEKRDLYKAEILQDAKYQSAEKMNLLSQIKKYPKVEANYLDLIFLYSESNQDEKALEIAHKLEVEIPNSEWAQVSLFKFHLNQKNGEQAVKSMNIVFGSKKIDDKVKHRMLNEFLIFVKNNPKYNSDLENAITYFKNDPKINVAKEVAKFYQNQNDFDKAIQYYELYFKDNSNDDLETLLLLLHCYTEKGKFDVLASKAEQMIDVFPSQPELYYYAGLANNQLKNFKKAKDKLESGIDFVINNNALEINFNVQLGEAYFGLGDLKKKELYFLKAEKLIQQQKK